MPPELRGTYAGLACAPVIDHFKRLGVTTVELMPVHAFLDDRHLVERGLRNYWGYNTIGFFAPEHRYSASGKVGEFKTMVRTLHAAGIEVILDVVYNHTAEGNQLGPDAVRFAASTTRPTTAWCRDNPRYYKDFTGCGNTLNMQHPRVLQLLMDSLRYWVTEMHVDGFRFDLASALARELHAVDRLSAFFDILRQDPVLSQVKLIAEPWDLGDGRLPGRQLPGRLGRVERQVPRHACAATGKAKAVSSASSRSASPAPATSTTAAAAGPTPASTSSPRTTASRSPTWCRYNDKHNEANGEDNRDGHDHNLSWNCGVEGPTDDAAVLRAARAAAAQLHRHAAAVAGRADAAGRRRDRPQPGRQQQRLLPGQRDQLARLDRLPRTGRHCWPSRSA